MVTFSDIVDDPDSPQSIIVWEIRTGKKKRSFQRGNAEDWPILKYIHSYVYILIEQMRIAFVDAVCKNCRYLQKLQEERIISKQQKILLRSLKCAYVQYVVLCRWNKDGEYFARMSDSLIGVYQTPVSCPVFL